MINLLLLGGGALIGAALTAVIKRALSDRLPSGVPTPKEAQVVSDAAKRVDAVAENGKLKLQEIGHASKDELLDKFRDSLRDDKAD